MVRGGARPEGAERALSGQGKGSELADVERSSRGIGEQAHGGDLGGTPAALVAAQAMRGDAAGGDQMAGFETAGDAGLELVAGIAIGEHQHHLVALVESRPPAVGELQPEVMAELENAGQHQIPGPGRWPLRQQPPCRRGRQMACRIGPLGAMQAFGIERQSTVFAPIFRPGCGRGQDFHRIDKRIHVERHSDSPRAVGDAGTGCGTKLTEHSATGIGIRAQVCPSRS